MIELDNKTVKSWTKGQTIINSFWSEKKGRQYVICKDDNLQYCLYRFFEMGAEVYCSVDIGYCSEEKFIQALMGEWVRDTN